MSDEESVPTVVVGFDALDFTYLDRFQDALPNFTAIREDGVEAPLRSTHPPWTGSAWPSMYTGMDPSRHGGYAFFDYEGTYPDEAELVTRNHVEAPALWNYTTSRNDPAIVLNVPVTHPAEEINGVLVPGYLAPEDASGHPDGIRDELSRALGTDYRIYSTRELDDNSPEKLQSYVELIGLRERAAKYLLTEYDWSLAVVQVQKTDTVFHNFTEDAAFRRVYEAADSLLGTIRETVDDANVVVCSDHGIGRADGYKIFINELLRQHGFLETTSDAGKRTLATKKSDLVNGNDSNSDAPTADSASRPLADRSLTALQGLLGTLNLSPGQVYHAAQRVGLESVLERLVPTSVQTALQDSIDWRSSRAYSRIGSELGVRINLEGREPAGVVPRDQYESVRDELISTLSSVETPDGRPAFDFVKRREEIYDGPFTEQACDVVFQPRDMNHPVLTSLVGTPFIQSDAFDHKSTGVFIATGPSFRTDPGGEMGQLSLTDVAPIALGASGYPVPERMEGTVPSGLLTARTISDTYADVEYGEERTSIDSDGVEDRLADLGYI